MYLSLLLSNVEGNSLVIALYWKLKGDTLVSDMMYGDGQPLTIGIVVSAHSKEKTKVMLRLDREWA